MGNETYSLQELWTFARISQESYNQGRSLGDIIRSTDYTLISRSYDPWNGFGGQAYYSQQSNQVVVAYAGTDGFVDIANDYIMVQAFGFHFQHTPALDFAAQAQNVARMIAINETVVMSPDTTPSLMLSGHSLGGEIAAYVTDAFSQARAVIFNAPGQGGWFGDVLEITGLASTNSRITHVVSGDSGIVNSAIIGVGADVSGQIITIPGASGHPIASIVNALSAAMEAGATWVHEIQQRGNGGGGSGSSSGGSDSTYGTGDDEYGLDGYTPDDWYDGTGTTNGDNFGDGDTTNDGQWSDDGWTDPNGYGIGPVILDLDGDGVEIAVNAQISFDWDGDGFLESGNWAAADDGFLVVDLEAANLPVAPQRIAA